MVVRGARWLLHLVVTVDGHWSLTLVDVVVDYRWWLAMVVVGSLVIIVSDCQWWLSLVVIVGYRGWRSLEVPGSSFIGSCRWLPSLVVMPGSFR